MINNYIIMSDISKTTINMPIDLKKQLKKIAIDKDTSLSGLILDIITDYVDSGKKMNLHKKIHIKSSVEFNI